MTDHTEGHAPPPVPPPLPPTPKPWVLPPELMEDDPFKEKRFQKELQFRMVGAIERGDDLLLKHLVQSGVNTNARILLVKTPLIHACEQDEIKVDLILTLLEGGADPNLHDFTPRSIAPLHVLAERGHLDAAKAIINKSHDKSCDLEVRDNAGCTPLHFAAQFGQLEMVEYLLEQSVDIQAGDYSGCTALHRACEGQHYEVAQYLLEHGHNPNLANHSDWTPIFYSAFFCHTDMVKLLVRYGADLTILESYNNSVLSAVCFCQHSKLDFYPIKRIVSTSFDYYERTWSIPQRDLKDHLITEDTYFLWDSDIRRLELVKLLVNSGADPNLYRSDGMALMGFGEFAKRRMFLILAGAKIQPDDIWVKSENNKVATETIPDWLSWFESEVTNQYSLKRQCRYSIRRNLATTRDINAAVTKLPVPSTIKQFLRLEDFEDLMCSFKHFQQKEEGLNPTFGLMLQCLQ